MGIFSNKGSSFSLDALSAIFPFRTSRDRWRAHAGNPDLEYRLLVDNGDYAIAKKMQERSPNHVMINEEHYMEMLLSKDYSAAMQFSRWADLRKLESGAIYANREACRKIIMNGHIDEALELSEEFDTGHEFRDVAESLPYSVLSFAPEKKAYVISEKNVRILEEIKEKAGIAVWGRIEWLPRCLCADPPSFYGSSIISEPGMPSPKEYGERINKLMPRSAKKNLEIF
jgi:hypothetical protein